LIRMTYAYSIRLFYAPSGKKLTGWSSVKPAPLF
jgi:hypothetical protein